MAAVVSNLIVALLMVVVVVVAMVTVLCRMWNKEHFSKGNDGSGGVRFQLTNGTMESYYESMSPAQDPAHFHHQPHPLHTPQMITVSAFDATDNGDHISMQDCPAYQPIEDPPTSGDVSYI